MLRNIGFLAPIFAFWKKILTEITLFDSPRYATAHCGIQLK